jgi:hypothetical protein
MKHLPFAIGAGMMSSEEIRRADFVYALQVLFTTPGSRGIYGLTGRMRR